MCGIAGAFGVDGPLHPELPSAVRRMTTAIAHRGPDGDGFFDAPRVCLAQRRLAIIDRAGGRQPMANEDESCWITFNGEIYNHRELRSKLEAKGHRYRTASDTETILHAYEEYGPACVDHLEGMFALAIYDGRRQELFAARDRLGKKPFFYTVIDGMFHFASELPALRQSPLWTGEIDLTGLEGYLSLGYFIAPATIYRNVHKLMPGHWLRIANGRLETRQYWDITEFDTDHRPDSELLPDIDAVLRQAVHERLESEVPLGAFLSGGIDSGLVVSYMAEALGDRLVTASVGFGNPAHNELAAAELTARHFQSRHFAELIEPKLDECIGPVMDHLGEPLADSSAIPTWYVSRAARRHVTVALSGDGGDEAWAGYDFRYVPLAMEAEARRWMPRAAASPFGWLGENWPRGRWVPKSMRAGTLLENLGRDPAGAYYADLAFMKPADTRQLMGLAPDRAVESSPVYQAVTEPFRRCPSSDLVQRAEYADLKVYMPNDPLVKVDRMSMAHSLEVRCPLLDRRVVELAFRIPASRKQVGRQGKALLRALARRRLPEGLWQLPKRGFTVPIAEWIAGPHLNMFREEVLRPTAAVGAHLDTADLERRVGIHVKRQGDQSHALWAVWVLERWLARTISVKGTPSLTRNVTSNWVGMAMGIVYALIITPIVVKALDARLYGAWSFLNGLLAYSELFYLGLGSAVIRYVAQARAADDRALINRLGSVVFSIYSAIGLLCVLITLGLSTKIPSLFADSLSPDVSRAVSITCILLGVRLLATFVSSAFTGLMCGHDRFDLINAVGMASGVVRFIAIPLLLHDASEPLLTLAVLTCVMSLVEAAAMISLAFWYIPGLAVRPTRPQSHELKLLYGFGFQSFLVLIAFKLISYTDTTVIGWRLGLASVALYSIPLQLVEYARMMVGGFSGVLLPRLTLLSTLNDLPQLREAYLSSARLGCFLAGWIGALVIALGPPFLARWVGPDYAASSHMVLVWLTVASFAQALSTQVPYPFYQALGLLAVPAVVLTLEGVTNLALSLWLAPKMGIAGVALATAIPAVLVSLVLLPPYLCRRLNVPLRTLAMRSVLPGVLMLVATLMAESLLANVIVADSYAQIAVRATLSLPVALLVFGTTFPSTERRMMWNLLRFRSGDTL